MKNIILFIKEKDLKLLQAISDESYLYNYIVNNYTELAEDNIFRNPLFIKQLDNMLYIAKDNISSDDIIVWNETNQELKKKNVNYYAIILDPLNGAFFVYNNLQNTAIPQLEINSKTDTFEAINKIEQFNNELDLEMEM